MVNSGRQRMLAVESRKSAISREDTLLTHHKPPCLTDIDTDDYVIDHNVIV